MKKTLLSYLNALFGKNLELRVRLFHVLALTGFIICVIMTGVSIAGGMTASTVINIGAGALSLGLLIYSAKSGRYRFCYMMTIVVIFFVLFPSLFFFGGGYKGGMSFFFVFAVVFTVYMLDGWLMLTVTALELVFYSGLCWLALRRPELIVPFQSEEAVVSDIIIGLVTVSISLGATMFVQVRMYQRQQKKLEKAQQAAEAASQAKSIFLANMSHEIRTPIHMILGMNEIIHRESRSIQVRTYSERIEQTSKMLLSLVDNVLDVSKIEFGKMELIPAPYETDNLVKTLVLIGRTGCKNKGLEFTFRAAEDLPPRLYGDLAHIRQIAGNFLSNAVKYTEKGRISLDISCKAAEDSDRIMLQISVTDTGSGICQEALPTLFDAFTRVDLAAHRYIEGTGLGLKIVKELTDLMGGTVAVESQAGRGSTFSVTLPQQVLPAEPESGVEPEMTFEAPEVRLLAVDDNEGNRMVMRELLRPTKIAVDTASSGEECLRMVRENKYHLILMDYMMPGMDGLETVRRLKQDPDFTIPVIALTADATAETGRRLLEGGFSACLTKPVPWPRLHDTLLSHLPRNLVTLIPRQKELRQTEAVSRELTARMERYGIVLDEALQYFENSFSRYVMMAELFLRHDAQEREKTEKLLTEGSVAQLRFPVHALKGKAKNLGMELLSEVCAHVEKLCLSGEEQEVVSLMPYLLYLWKRGAEGLELMVREHPVGPAQPAARRDGNCCARLPGLLREFRRKPSLDCIDQMLQEEQEEQGRTLICEIREKVDSILFEQAEEAFQAYLQWKKGGEAQ